MQLLAILAGLVQDLLGSLRPVRWLMSKDERAATALAWRQSTWLGKVGVVFGLVLMLCLFAVVLALTLKLVL